MPGAVEEAHPELRLQISNRMADRRLNSGEARSGRAEAPSFRDGDEDAHLIERKASNMIYSIDRLGQFFDNYNDHSRMSSIG